MEETGSEVEVIYCPPTYEPTPEVTEQYYPHFEVNQDFTYNPELTIEEKEEQVALIESYIIPIEEEEWDNEEESEMAIFELETIKDQQLRDIISYEQRYEEYPVACEIWSQLTEIMELEDIQAAGILGNMMVEAGSHSLSIDPYAYGGSYYGICQWSTSYHQSINGGDLQSQLAQLEQTIEGEFSQGSSSYSTFLSATTPEDASVSFARGYERCADPYGRQNCARRAQDYFVD